MPAINPGFDDFAASYDAGKAQVLWSSLVADLETPVSTMLKLAAGRPNSFLLESVEGGAVRGRYSIIGLKPDLIWRCRGDKAEINHRARYDSEAFEPCNQGALASLRALIADSQIDLPDHLPPMAAGLVGYMGYDMVRLMENRLGAPNPDPLGLPDGMFLRPTIMAIFDGVTDMVTLVTPVRPTANVDARAAWAQGCERLADAIADFNRPLPRSEGMGKTAGAPAEPTSNTRREEFLAMVERARDYITAGDIFQVVLSQRFSLPFTLPPFALYRALRRINPAPFLVYLDFGDFSMVCSSPEILVRLRDGEVTVRPIAGTRPRGANREEDEALAADLLADPKERAEHLMLLDLGRNDVGRIARLGTVKVTEKEIIEYYSHVMHIVSNVAGELAEGRDALDALAAGFPAGTVSGAPKVRAMEIIDELEKEKRGIYAGAAGYFSANGGMDTCIVLRTAVVKDGMMHVQAGAGIVADSVPEAEYEETRAKARALMRAAAEAVRFAADKEGG
jgi:anthranilate synthase component 1